MKIVNASEVIHRFAALVRDWETSGPPGVILPAPAGDLLLICRKARGYAEHQTGSQLPRSPHASELLSRFGDLIANDSVQDEMRRRDPGHKLLLALVQAMIAWSRNCAGWNLVEGKRLAVVAGRGGLRIK